MNPHCFIELKVIEFLTVHTLLKMNYLFLKLYEYHTKQNATFDTFEIKISNLSVAKLAF